MAFGTGVRVNAQTRLARVANEVATRSCASILIHKLPGVRRHPRRARTCSPNEEISFFIFTLASCVRAETLRAARRCCYRCCCCYSTRAGSELSSVPLSKKCSFAMDTGNRVDNAAHLIFPGEFLKKYRLHRHMKGIVPAIEVLNSMGSGSSDHEAHMVRFISLVFSRV